MIKTYEAETKAIEGERAFNVTITTTTKDRDGDIVEAKGAILTNYRKNPVVLMAHDYRNFPIARAEKLEKTDNSIRAKVVFPPEGEYPIADIAYRLYKGNFMRAWSIGFIPMKSEDIIEEDEKESEVMRKGRRIKSWELLEFSACAVPSNPEALTNMMEKGINLQPLKEAGFIEIEDKEEIEEKGVIPFKETSKAPEDEEWDAPKEIREAEVSDLKIMCAWVNSENPDIKTSYKLPHHKAKGHAVVWRGVAAAMAALLGARGGVDIPESDKKGVYNHLIKHYEQFDKEPPELRDYEEEELEELFQEKKQSEIFNPEEIYKIVKENKELKEKIKELELKFGAVLNAKNKQNLKQAQALIQEVLDSAEPAEEDSLEIADEKGIKDDNAVIDLEDDQKDVGQINEEKDEDIIEVDEETIAKAIDEKMAYILGKVKK